MQVKKILAAAAVAALGLGAVNANAAQVQSTFQVSMTITSICAVTTAPTNINLGTYAAQAAAISQTTGNSTTFKVNCSNKTPFSVGLAPSNGNASGVGAMSATGVTDTVPYKLYSDAILSTAWGNTTGTGGNVQTGTGGGMATSKAVSFTAYAQATSADFAPATYTDTVTVNVNY